MHYENFDSEAKCAPSFLHIQDRAVKRGNCTCHRIFHFTSGSLGNIGFDWSDCDFAAALNRRVQRRVARSVDDSALTTFSIDDECDRL